MGFKYNSRKYKLWRDNVFYRDRFQCKLCGTKGGALNAHHIKRKADYPNLAHTKKNGIVLCEKCHKIITGHERVFEKLFNYINKKDLTVKYVKSFFLFLTKYHKEIVEQFKNSDKWLKIASNLVEIIEKQKNDS